MNNSKAIQALNRLIGINNERINGYESALKKTEELDLKQLFFQLIQTSKKCNTELISEVSQLGGKPIVGTTLIGKIFKVWLNFKAELIGKNRRAILTLCEYGEYKAMDTYNYVIRNNAKDLHPDQHRLISLQCSLIKSDHNVVKELQLNYK